MEAAAALVEARDLCEHGEWAPWLAKTGIPERTANRMIHLARAGIKPATVADLGAGRVNDIIARLPALPDGEAMDDWVHMGAFVEGVRAVYVAAYDHYAARSDHATVGMVSEAFPSTYAAARVWAEWGRAEPDGDEGRHERIASAPWLVANDPEPEPIAA